MECRRYIAEKAACMRSMVAKGTEVGGGEGMGAAWDRQKVEK